MYLSTKDNKQFVFLSPSMRRNHRYRLRATFQLFSNMEVEYYDIGRSGKQSDYYTTDSGTL